MPLDTMRRAAAGGAGVLHVYHPLGFPSPGQDAAYLQAALDHGAGVIELGLPFSDPSADGPVLQAAMAQALRAGGTFSAALATARGLRDGHPKAGLVAMAYANALHVHGFDAAARRLARAALDGVIVPDMPLREARRVADGFQSAGVPLVPLAASTVPDATLRALGALRPPFVYVASLGVTGGDGPRPDAVATVRRLRATVQAPVTCGFGVRTPEHARTLRKAGAHGVVVGSALVRAIQDGASPQAYGRLVRGYAEAVV